MEGEEGRRSVTVEEGEGQEGGGSGWGGGRSLGAGPGRGVFFFHLTGRVRVVRSGQEVFKVSHGPGRVGLPFRWAWPDQTVPANFDPARETCMVFRPLAACRYGTHGTDQIR